jgi:Big-like domain-containing protein
MARGRVKADPDARVGDAWAFGKRYRRRAERAKRPLAVTVLLTLSVTFLSPVAFAEDTPIEGTTASTGPTPTAAPEPSPEPSLTPEPSAEPVPSPEPPTAGSAESPVETVAGSSAAPGPSSTSEPPPAPSVSEPASPPTIASDRDDYPPGAIVILSGSNWLPGEQVHIRVNDDQGMTWRRDVDVFADGNGNLRDEFQLPDWFVATYSVTATGAQSGTATTTFTDANVTSATVAIRTAASTTTCTSTAATSFASGDRACARSTITNLNNNNPGQTGDMSVLWVNPSGATVQTNTHNGASGSSFDDTLVVNAVGTWTVKVCTNASCPASAVLDSKTFTVTAANTAPTISDIVDQTINEDASTGALAFTVGDAQTPPGSLTVSGSSSNTTLIPNASIVFGGSGGNRTITLTPAGNRSGSATITVTVSDGSLSSSDTFVLTVRSVNDAPSGTDKTLTIGEDSSHTFVASDFGFSDPEDSPANTFAAVKIASLPGSGALAFGGNPVSLGDEIAVGNLGNLVFSPGANGSGSPYASFGFRVKDDGGTANGGAELDGSVNTITFNVTPVNDAPVCANVTLTTDEDTPGETDPDCTDVDGDALTYAVGAASDGTSGVAAGKLTYDPDQDFNGTDSFTYTANDGTVDSNAADVDVTVTPVNDAPRNISASFLSSSVACPTTLLPNNVVLRVIYEDPDASDSHTAEVDWDDDASTDNSETIDPAESPFYAVHSYGSAGLHSASVTVSDLAGDSVTGTATVTVNFTVVGGTFKQPVNDTRNGQSPPSVFKHGSTIPLKLEVTDCDGTRASNLDIRIHWQRISGGVPQGELEGTSTSSADTGNRMRFADPQYMFNWSTKLVSDPTSTVLIQATIVATGQKISTEIGLKK